MSQNCFTLVEDATSLLPLLKRRLPISSNIYNMALFSSKFKDVLKFYIFGADFDSDETWIITAYKREDYGMEYFLSTNLEVKVTPETKNVFMDSKLFDWDCDFIFGVFDHSIAIMLTEISIQLGNATKISPVRVYSVTQIPDENAATESSQLQLVSLNSVEGLEFMCSNWKYCVNGSRVHIKRILDRLPSVGCTVEGKLASGLVALGNGLMGMLHTDKSHRNKNYAKICMQTLCRKLAKEGYQPCSMVDVKNEISHSFHRKIGMNQTDVEAYFVYYQNSEI